MLNHSCDPTTWPRENDMGAYDFIALRDLKAGDELTFDYEITEWELTDGGFECGCRSAEVRDVK